MTSLTANFQSTVKRNKTSILFYIVTGKVITVKDNKLELIDISELGNDNKRMLCAEDIMCWSLKTGLRLEILLGCMSPDIARLDICSGEYKILLSGKIEDLSTRERLVDALQRNGYEEI